MAAGSTCAFLGLAQADRHGNLNVSRFGPRLAGAGGFINISQSAKAVVFVGTFTAGPLEVGSEQTAGSPSCAKATSRKFVAEVEHRTFSGDYALKRGQPVLYVTERCVFRLTPSGLELIEVAPGIDIERDILAHMDFAPIVRRPAADGRAHLRRRADGAARPHGGDAARAALQLRCQAQHAVHRFPPARRSRASADVERIKAEVERRVQPLGHGVHAIVNYRGCRIDPGVLDSYRRMVEALEESRYLAVTRYGMAGCVTPAADNDRGAFPIACAAG